MGIDIKTETLIALSEGHKLPVPRGYKTLYRWVKEGVVSRVNGQTVRLEAVQIGGVLHTSVEAHARFVERLNKENS